MKFRTSRYSFSHEVAASPEVVWALVADHEGMSAWMPVRSAVLETEGSPQRNGVGAIRALHALPLGPALREKVTAFEPPTRLAYTMLSGAPVRDYTGEIVIEPSGTGSRFTWSVQLRPLVPGVQFVVAVVIRTAASALAKRAARGAAQA